MILKAGNVLVISYEGDSESGTFQITGKDLTLRMDGDNETFEIIKFTNSELDLFGSADVDEDDDPDEVTFHLSKT